jgi:hypothetical protein
VILNAIAQAFVGMVTWILGLIPSASAVGLPDFSAYGAAIGDSRIWQWFGWANHFVPLDLVMLLLGVRLALWLVMYGVELVVWVIGKIPIIGNGS